MVDSSCLNLQLTGSGAWLFFCVMMEQEKMKTNKKMDDGHVDQDEDNNNDDENENDDQLVANPIWKGAAKRESQINKRYGRGHPTTQPRSLESISFFKFLLGQL